MGNRGQKRNEATDALPADKRACSSLESRPSSSNSSVQTQVNSANSTHEAQENDMDTSSSTSGSSNEGERELAYGSCDSDGQNSLHHYRRRQSSDDHSKFKRALSSLSELSGESGQLAALTELCELLSFCTDSSISSLMADSFSPTLVKLARHESNPDIMLLAIRAITYLCDVHPRSSAFLVRHDAVPALCQRLMAIEYLDVAEQCLQALEKISREQPLACLQSGAIMAVLSYIDFFSTSVQRVALSTVVNICKKLPSESPSPFMEAIPILCNLLQYEDRQLVECVATCLIKIAERVQESSDMLDELCKHGLIHQATHLIDLNGRTSLCQPVYNGLIGLLVKLARGSVVAVRTLFELNISSILKDVLSTYSFSQGLHSPPMVDGNCNQVHEVLKLLNELLPVIERDEDIKIASDKEALLLNRSDLLQKFALDLLPVLIQVVNSGVNLYVCYGCLSVINKLVYFSKSDMLLELLKTTNISSFLAGVFTRKDHHVLMLALQVVDTILHKLSDEFLDSFVKEGVLFAVEALITPDKCSQYMFPSFNGIQMSNDRSEKLATRDVLRCLCFAFNGDRSPSASESGNCKLEKASVYNLAKHIKAKYFSTELLKPEKGLTDILQKLKNLAAALNNLVNTSLENVASTQHEEEFYYLLHEIMSEVDGQNPISTFEFVESGIVKSLVNYLSNGQFLKTEAVSNTCSRSYIIEKRFEVFGRLFGSSSNSPLLDFLLSALIQKLQSALASVENFPVILSHAYKRRNSFATVPYGRCTAYPCLKVKFVKGEGETFTNDYTEDVVTVDPFCPLNAIEEYVWSRVKRNRTECIKLVHQAFGEVGSSDSCMPSGVSLPQAKSPELMESDSVLPDVPGIREDKFNLSQSTPRRAAYLGHATIELTASSQLINDHVDQEQRTSSDNDGIVSTKFPDCINKDASPKLLFFLEDQQLDHSLTLYQAIVQQQIKAGHEIINGTDLWSQVYRVTYRRAVKPKQVCSEHRLNQADCSSLMEKQGTYWHCTSFFSGFIVPELVSFVEISSPIYDILFLLKSLEAINRLGFHLMSREKIFAFAEGRIDNLDDLKVAVQDVLQKEFVSSKLTEKLEQQMRDSLAVSVGGMPSWCSQLMALCSSLFGFEARCKYFRLAAFGQQLGQQPSLSSHNSSGGQSSRRYSNGGLPRKKFLVHRNRILESAAQMMDLHASQKVVLEVEYDEEVGTGLGPTLEFYTLVSQEFQKLGLQMWREDHMSSTQIKSSQAEDSLTVASPFGLFPRPWSSTVGTSNGIEFSEVIKKFVLLGQIVAKALQDGRVFDIPFSKAFYKLMLSKELTVYDIQSFDPGLCRVLLEFQALAERKRYLESVCGVNPALTLESSFRKTKIEDLCLDFTLPGYPDYILSSGLDPKMVNMVNLEEYVLLVVDATINSGISRQVKAFKSGFDQVFPIRHLQIFNEEELEHLLCGEHDILNSNEFLDHIKLDHGYTASSPPVINLLAIIQEFDHEQRRAFLQFVTGAPRLPPGGLASLNPKLTIVRKHCSKYVDADLPSVMTCANYLKLPPYSSKERVKEKLLYAITEGQGSFHLS